MTIMSELGPRAREILHSGRELNRPTVADRERIDNALRSRLGAALLTSGSYQAMLPPRPRWPFLTSVVIGAGLIGGSVFLATRPPPVSPPPTHTTAPAVVVTRASSPPSSLESTVEPSAPETAKSPALTGDHLTASARP